MAEKITESDHVERAASRSPSTSGKEKNVKFNKQGIALIPQPSDDPRDPLNWSSGKKTALTMAIMMSGFATAMQSVTNISGYAPQATLYRQSVVKLTYSIAVCMIGLAFGAYLLFPLSTRFGKCWLLFWGVIGTMAMNIWSAAMTGSGDYGAFMASRLFAGITGASVSILGPQFLCEIFFLHDRGKVIGVYYGTIMFGIAAAPSFSGYIVYFASWTIQFWYQVGLHAVCAILVFLFVEETGWHREGGPQWPDQPRGWWAKRQRLYFNIKGFHVSPYLTPAEEKKAALRPLLATFSPIMVLGGFVVAVTMGWVLAIQTFIAIYLMTPKIAGGYSFTAKGVATFMFCNWIGVIASQLYAAAVYDRLPLIICRRFYHGVWHPELRLHAIWPIMIIYPIGLGLFGAGLQEQWHYMSLAVCVAISQFSGAAGLGIVSNYLVEALGSHVANEVAIAVSCYRLVLGFSSIFFLTPWGDAVGPRWVFGTQAFLQLAAGGVVLFIVNFGPWVRSFNLVDTMYKEEIQVFGREE
ncbi:unnamed protein product [Cercospora beticola]|nr:unnamed protein product [Cercospora beticola]